MPPLLYGLQPITLAIGEKRVFDVRGYGSLVCYPDPTATVTHSVVHAEAATVHGADQTGPSVAGVTVDITVRANFYMIEALIAPVNVHVVA